MKCCENGCSTVSVGVRLHAAALLKKLFFFLKYLHHSFKKTEQLSAGFINYQNFVPFTLPNITAAASEKRPSIFAKVALALAPWEMQV